MDVKFIFLIILIIVALPAVASWQKIASIDDVVAKIDEESSLDLVDVIPPKDLEIYLKKIRKYLFQSQEHRRFTEAILQRIITCAGEGQLKLTLFDEDFLEYRNIFAQLTSGQLVEASQEATRLMSKKSNASTELGKEFLRAIRDLAKVQAAAKVSPAPAI